MTAKMIPYDVEAEEAVLGAVICDPRLYALTAPLKSPIFTTVKLGLFSVSYRITRLRNQPTLSRSKILSRPKARRISQRLSAM